jgi:hypothetical protein
MKDYVFLILILVLAVVPPIFSKIIEPLKNRKTSKDGFTNYTLGGASGNYPCAENNVLVQDTYPITGINGVSDESAEKMWKRYPIFEVGSYKQMTNNIRYPNNPDDARCMPANFCYALYKDRDMGSNIVTPLPPVNPNSGTRIGYFATGDNLLPYRTDVPNILY